MEPKFESFPIIVNGFYYINCSGGCSRIDLRDRTVYNDLPLYAEVEVIGIGNNKTLGNYFIVVPTTTELKEIAEGSTKSKTFRVVESQLCLSNQKTSPKVLYNLLASHGKVK